MRGGPQCLRPAGYAFFAGAYAFSPLDLPATLRLIARMPSICAT